GNKLQVATGKAQVSDAQAVALDTKRLLIRQENLLSLLLGRVPGPIVRSNVAPGMHATGSVPAGRPCPLVQPRPDALSAAQQLVAGNGQIGVAEAGFCPRSSLTAVDGFASPDLTTLINPSKAFVCNAGGSVSWLAPILQGEALRGQAEAVSAQWEAAKNTYE